MRHRPAALVVTLALGATAVFADDWPGPRTVSVFSEDGGRFVRLVPGTSVGETVGFAGAPNGGPARGEFDVRQRDRSYRLVADVALANPVAPVEALVSNTGHLITFDNWHNAGYGAVVAIYDPSGRLVRAWWLEDLYDPYAYQRPGADRGIPGSCEEITAAQSELRRKGTQGYTGSNPIPTECERCLRGGAFNYDGPGLRSSNRVHHPSRFRLIMSGVRCAKDG